MALPYLIEQIALDKKTPLLENTSSIFSVGTGKDEQGNQVDYSTSVEKGQFSDVVLKGNTYTSGITNGNFANGTTGWSAGESSISASNNTLTITGNGSGRNPYAYKPLTISPVSGKKIFFRAKLKVTNANCTKASVRFQGASGGDILEYIMQSSPIQNAVYEVKGIATLTNQTGILRIWFMHSYADITTANGKVMEVQEVFAIDMTAAGLEDLTADEMNAKFPHYFDGTKSTNCPTRIQTRNKNQWRKGTIVYGVNAEAGYGANGIWNADNTVTLNAQYQSVGNILKVLPNTTYKISARKTAITDNKVNLYVDNVIKGSIFATRSTYTVTSNSKGEIKIVFGTGYTPINVNIVDIMLTYDTAEQTYVVPSYTEAYTPAVGGSLPNGTKDEIRVSGGKAEWIKRNNKKVLQASDITSMMNLSNTDAILFRKPTDDINRDNLLLRVGSLTMQPYTLVSSTANYDTVENIGKIFPNQSLTAYVLLIQKGTYANFAEAQAALTGLELTYQLSTPIVTDVDVEGELFSYGAGTTVMIDPYYKRTVTYGTGLTFDYPVSAIDRIVDKNGNDVLSTDITLAVDGLSATIANAIATDVFTVYAPIKPENSTIPTVIHSVGINTKSQINSNTASVIKLDKKVEELDDYTVRYLLNLENRLSVLENV